MSLLNVKAGDEVVMDTRPGVTTLTWPLRVTAVTPKRFIAEGIINGHFSKMTFRKMDGRSVGDRCVHWARKA